MKQPIPKLTPEESKDLLHAGLASRLPTPRCPLAHFVGTGVDVVIFNAEIPISQQVDTCWPNYRKVVREASFILELAGRDSHPAGIEDIVMYDIHKTLVLTGPRLPSGINAAIGMLMVEQRYGPPA